jgi:threonine dehydrogenase-like Zn-dependent dehydrogenase
LWNVQFTIHQRRALVAAIAKKYAQEFGATDIVSERGDEGVARIKEITNGIGADSALECVGNPESMQQAIQATRPGGSVGFVGVPHGVSLDGRQLFLSQVCLHGDPAPVLATCQN